MGEILADNQRIVLFIGMIVYLAMVITVGLIYSRRNKSTEDFFLGGRSLGPWVTAMSAEASDMSSWLLMGLPGLAMLSGSAEAMWVAFGLAIGTYLNWKFVAFRLRTYTQIAGNAITVPDFFSNRFHDKKKIIMSISALIIFVFFTVYTASGFSACGKLFESLFGFDYHLMMIISGVIIVIYTIVGGFLAESTTDFIQGCLMFISLIVVLFVAVNEVQGIANVIATGQSMDGFFAFASGHDRLANGAYSISILQIISYLAWGLGYFGMPHVLLRFMAIKDPKQLKKSRIIACTWCFISLAVAVVIGLVGAAAVPEILEGTTAETAKATAETVFIVLTQILGSKNFILTVFSGIIMSGILAATMSTSDSQLLVTSSAISQNFFKGLIKKDASDKQILWISRIVIVLVAVIAAIIALDKTSAIFDIVGFAWAGFGASFGPVILFSLFWKRTTLAGAVAGMLSGGATVFIWSMVLKRFGGIFNLYELLPAFIIGCLAIVVVSLMTKAPDKAIIDEFERAKRGEV